MRKIPIVYFIYFRTPQAVTKKKKLYLSRGSEEKKPKVEGKNGVWPIRLAVILRLKNKRKDLPGAGKDT